MARGGCMWCSSTMIPRPLPKPFPDLPDIPLSREEENLWFRQAVAAMPLRRKGAKGKGPKPAAKAEGSAVLMRRRRPALDEAEQSLWRAFTASIKPLSGKVLPEAVLPPAPPAPPAPPPAPALAVPRAPAGPQELQVGVAPGGLDGKRWKELRRGRLRPERKLDLHGQRVQDAHAAVRRFLHDAVADGLRCVVIVTGKGSTPEGGILRREFPHWLNAPDLRPLVLGAAHPHSANPGAVHLLLRRRK